MEKINIYNFAYFWEEFHRLNYVRKLDKAKCRKIWEACNFKERYKKAIDGCKGQKDAYNYLDRVLNYPF